MPAAKATPLHRPNLAGVINPDDLFKKGGHDYVAWARVAHYIHENANGWECDMRCAPDGGHVWKAPNGTGYLVLFFQGPEGQVSADFPYAITNFKNQPIKLEQIDCFTLCNAQRRGFAACAAYTFGLGYELWAKEEVTAVEPELVPADSPSSNSPRVASKTKAAPKPAAKANPVEGDPLADRKAVLTRKLKAYYANDPGIFPQWEASVKERFPEAQPVEKLTIDWLYSEEQVTHTELFVTQYEAQLQQNQAKAAA